MRVAIGGAEEFDAALQLILDHDVGQLSLVERGILLLAAWELRHAEVPYKVVNEAIELAKSYGGTDGHQYVNGVRDKLAAKLRPKEKRA